MSYQLVIAEKPSVARSIAGVNRGQQETGRLHGGERLSGELVHRPPCFPCRRRSL